MSSVIATGGESGVVTNPTNPDEAVKAVPMKDDFKLKELDLDNLDFGNIKTTYDKERPRELTSNDLNHPNIIEFKESSFQFVDNELIHLTGKFNFNQLNFSLNITKYFIYCFVY